MSNDTTATSLHWIDTHCPSNMGGNIFLTAAADGQPTLWTARLCQATYNQLKTTYLQRLSAQLPHADSIRVPLEAPDKSDHGDIDIIVAYNGNIDWTQVAAGVGAVAWVDRGSESHPQCSLAVRLDGERSDHAPVKYIKTNSHDRLPRKPSEVFNDECFAQIDLEQISPELQDWTAFYGSYGDLAGIFGMNVTNCGFDITSTGLRLRLQEFDDSTYPKWSHFNPPRDDGRMILSTNPAQIMAFFGLNVQRYYAGFESAEEIFLWLGECRMLSESSLKRDRNIPASREERSETREMFHAFFKVWLPAFLNARRNEESTATAESDLQPTIEDFSTSERRQKYLDEALDFFDQRQRYVALHSAFLRKRGIDTAEARLRPMIITHSGKKGAALAELMRAFRRNVARRDDRLAILEESNLDVDSELPTLLDQSGLQLVDPEGVRDWVKLHLDQVKDVERQRSKKRKLGQQDIEGLELAQTASKMRLSM